MAETAAEASDARLLALSVNKRCTKCLVVKEHGQFWRDRRASDGRMAQCKACRPRKTPEGKRRDVENQKRHRQTTKGRAARERYLKRYADANKNKRKASYMVRNAVRNGLLSRQPCANCGTAEDVQAHHEDYARPLDVIWLCRRHHMDAHSAIRERDGR